MDSFFEYLSLVFYFIICFAGWFTIQYIRKLPDQIHQRNIKSYEHELNKQLEQFKIEISRELEMLKITESQLHIHKAKEFSEFIEFFSTKIMNKEYMSQINKPHIQKEIQQIMMKTVTKFFFFASDETVKKFVEWRRLSLQNEGQHGFKIVYIVAELIVLMRKDLGYKDTECDEDDVLYLILTDWSEEKSRDVKEKLLKDVAG